MKNWIVGMVSTIGLLIFNLVLTAATRELVTFVQKIVPSDPQEQAFGSSLSIYEKIGCFISVYVKCFQNQILNHFFPIIQKNCFIVNEIQFINIFENFLRKRLKIIYDFLGCCWGCSL